MVKGIKQNYNWKRFWCPRADSFDLSDGGYLRDPGLYNPHVKSFESITSIPCLVLLGEPGIGKTYAMQTAQKAVSAEIKEKGEQVLNFDLRSYGSEDRLVRELFGGKIFSDWIEAEYRLHVFLDSLDECLLRIDTLAALLVDKLKEYPVDRICLRIACRTADWPGSLEEGLKQLWGGDALGVYELTPLRQEDVIDAAKAYNLDDNKFLQEIDQRGVVPLAIKPVTLNFLINTYSKNGRFPSTQAELYLQGCRLLCEETNEGRRDARLTGSFTPEQRLAAASRIAAVTIFSNRYAIWMGTDFGDVPDEDVTDQKLCCGSEDADGSQFDVTEKAIEETLSTGLFSSRGLNRMGWAHQTYAEFLAARYLEKHKMTLTQIRSLFIHPGDNEAGLVPQLHETAAWLASMSPEVFNEILRVNPEVLLRSDVATAEKKDRVALVESLLKAYDEKGCRDPDWNNQKRYKKLGHPGLEDQLRPYICDSTKGSVVRSEAIKIAEACGLRTFQDNLATIALDKKEPLEIRKTAIHAIKQIADDRTKVKLKPLVTGDTVEDSNDDLKGCSLMSLWPDHIKAKELFTAITSIKQRNYIGAYWWFLSHELVPKLKPSDLPVALKWVEQQVSLQDLTYCFKELMDAIILKTWEHLDTPRVLRAFVKAVLSRFKQHYKIVESGTTPEFRKILSDEDSDNKRRKTIEAVIPLISDVKQGALCLVFSETPLVFRKDVKWMLDRLQKEKSKKRQFIWAKLIDWVFDWDEPDQRDAILDACDKNGILAETFSSHLKPIELNSPEAEKMKADYSITQECLKRDEERPLLNSLPAERILGLLDECESGNPSAWWRLNMEMTLEPDSRSYGSDDESDLTVLPGWKNADDVTRRRIVDAAKRYVLKQDPGTHKWLGKDIIYRPAFAGYRALQLLLQEIPDFISSLSVDVWKKWAPIILDYPIFGSGSGDRNIEVQKELIKLSYQYAPDEIIQTLVTIIDKENTDYGQIFITQRIERIKGCWDSRLASVLMDKVKDANLNPECMGVLLSNLLGHNVTEARIFAESLISSISLSDEIGLSRAIIAARELLLYTKDAGRSVIWSAIQKDTGFGKKVIERLASDPEKPYEFPENAEKVLTEGQLANLYIWIVHQYPHTEDPELNSDGKVDTRKKIAVFRDSILIYLKRRGTPEACKAIQQIINEFPELNWLKWELHEAREIMRRKTWEPLKPCEILKMTRDQLVRLIQNGEQLLEVLVESLERLEKELQRKPQPAAIDLWNKIKKGKKNAYRPKDENEISDYIVRHLRKDLCERGVVINREVEIQRGEGSGQGVRTDIHVNAVIRNQDNEIYDTITVIIEVKGCWHRDLYNAMDTQLVGRYLKDNHCQYGLYLVGWFNCDQWDTTDSRKGHSLNSDINKARKQFDEQASALSQQNVRIKAFVVNMALH
ncbi:MAG: hypothetical protein OZ917_00110 [Candidatus Brocadiaceae bacterium]|nr:hypothetical protein [Candidatus Brocadiaceae bacterium]